MDDHEKTRERVVSVASQAVGPTAQEDHLQAQVEALQGRVQDLQAQVVAADQAFKTLHRTAADDLQQMMKMYDFQEDEKQAQVKALQGQVQDLQTRGETVI